MSIVAETGLPPLEFVRKHVPAFEVFMLWPCRSHLCGSIADLIDLDAMGVWGAEHALLGDDERRELSRQLPPVSTREGQGERRR